MKNLSFLFAFIFAAISVTSGQSSGSQRLALLEEFTQASAGPCAAANPSLNALLASNTSKVVSLKYETSWPGVDPMNAQDASDVSGRVSYYNWITGVPIIVFDGDSISGGSSNYTGYPGDLTQSVIDTEYALPSPFTINLTHTMSAHFDTVFISCGITASVAATYTGPLILQIALTETEIDFCTAPGSNGESAFYNVMRKMIPSASGTSLNTTWSLNQTSPHLFAVAVPSYIYNKNRLAVVAFIQDGSNKSVKQAAYSSPILLPLDAGFGCNAISGIPTMTCNPTITPSVTLKNFGSSVLTSATIDYKADATLSYSAYSWTGSVSSGSTTNVTLPSTSVTSGPHTFYVSVTSPNSGSDYNSANNLATFAYNIGSSSGATVPPLTEGFTSTTFPPTGWTNVDLSNSGPKWARSTAAGGYGTSSNSAYINFYNISAGDMDELVIKPVDLSGGSAASLAFDLAYAQYSASYVDTISVMVSTNCGATWNTIYQKYGSTLATNGTGNYVTSSFTPTATQWRTESVSLNTYTGNQVVYIKFHSGSGYGNNAYIDNINISFAASQLPVAGNITGPSSICAGATATYSVAYSAGVTYSWTAPAGWTGSGTSNVIIYTAGSTGGNITVTPSNSYGTGTPSSVYVSVGTASSAPVYILASPFGINTGFSSTLSFAGGTIGIGATWNWYQGACGTSVIGQGTTLVVSPTSKTTYYLRAQGPCNTTNCISVTVTVSSPCAQGQSPLWSDNFSTPSQWSLTHASGTTSDWVIGTSSMTSNMHTYMGAFSNAIGNVAYFDGITMLINANGAGTVPLVDAYCTTAGSINLSGYSSVSLKFSQLYKAFNSDTTFVQFSTNGGTTWPFSISVNPKNQVTVNTWGPDSISLNVSQYIANQSNVKIRFTFMTTSTSPLYGCGYGWAIDNIVLFSPCSNDLKIFKIFPSFDNFISSPTNYYSGNGTYLYYPQNCPTRIFNGVIAGNVGAYAQPNSILTAYINDPGNPYSASSPAGLTINPGIVNDTLMTGYTGTTNPVATNPFFLNCNSFTSSPVSPLGNINYNYSIIYYLHSDSSDQNPLNNVDTFQFHVGYTGNPYTGGPNLINTFARNNQNPLNPGISPQNWSQGGTDGDGLYMAFTTWKSTTEIHDMDVFIHQGCTFDPTIHLGSTITGIIYKWDTNSMQWIQQIASNPYDLSPSDTGHWKHLPFLLDGSSEFLSPGIYIAGIEITYNSLAISIGCDQQTLQQYSATFWKFAGSTNPTPSPLTNFIYSPMINVNVYSPSASSVAANSASATPNPLCSGSSTSLNLSGGSLGSGANWDWYSGSCGGTYIGSGSTHTVTPSVASTYWVRAEGTLNTTSCVSVTIILSISSSPATSLTGNPSTICSGSSTALSVTGGNLGTNAAWHWYSGTCAGTAIGSGTIIAQIPSISTTYFVRAEGTCNTTACVSVSVTVNQASVAAGTVTASPSSICYGQSATMTFSGGSLGTGATWKWYTGSCGGTMAGTGLSITQTPAATTMYWVRAEGLCNTTGCSAASIIVNSLSSSATSASASPQIVCSGNTITLSLTGGSLGNGAIWSWYSLSCGVLLAGTGSTIIQSPSGMSTYYVRAEGICNTTSCASVTVNVNTISTAPVSASSVPSTACPGSTVTLMENGGSLGAGANWNWYSGSCGGTYIMSGSAILQTISVNSTYYVRAENSCNSTACVSTRIIVNTVSSPSSSASSTSPVCSGNYTTLSKTGGTLGTGGAWYWYSGGCGLNYIGINATILDIPTTTTTYYVRAEGTCNTTTCSSTTVIVYTSSTAATSAGASPSTICTGSPVTLNVSGGNTGIGAGWHWYSGSCGGTASGTGTTIILIPSSLTTYFVRAENICNSTTCASVTVNVYSISTAPDSVISNPSIICSGSASTLSISGGSPGFSGIWKWYSGACGGISIRTGLILIISPTVNTTYYARAEGLCNTTGCASSTIIITQNSLQASSLSATYLSLCSGTGDTLTVSGGSLAIGANWHWYTVSCGGTYFGTNSSIIVYPVIDSVYYARAEGLCNTTACISIKIIINSPPLAPLSVTTDRNNYCSNTGGNIVLSSSGGSGGKIVWYRLSCGGTLVGTGNPKSITAPASSTKYWARWETSGCSGSTCASVAVTVLTSSTVPAAVTSSSYSLCYNSGGSITLTGSGGTGTGFGWYTGSCGGTGIGTGRILTIPSPTATSTYWGRNQTVSCGNSSCKSLVVSIVSSIPVQPDTIIGNTFPVAGGIEVYSVTNIPGITYTWTAPTGWSGTSFTNSITYIVGSGSGYISVIPSNGCGSGLVRTLDVSTGYNITGNFTYDNLANTPMDSVWVYLMQNGSMLDSIQADINGYYYFNKVQNGTYNITAKTHKPSGGVNATDAVKVKRHFAGSEYINTSIRLHAADVNMSFDVNTTDAVKITRRFAGSDLSFTRGDWVFEKPSGGDTVNVTVYPNDTVIINGNNIVQNFQGLCVGDVNCSNVPGTGAKSPAKVVLDHFGSIRLHPHEIFELPVLVSEDIEISAISLILNLPASLSVIDAQLLLFDSRFSNSPENSNFIYYGSAGELRIGWFANDEDIKLTAGDILLTLRLMTNSDITKEFNNDITVKNDPLCELADRSGNPLENVSLKTLSVIYSDNLNISSDNHSLRNDMVIYPNPAQDIININYNIENQGKVQIFLFDILGDKKLEIVNSIQPSGSYDKEVNVKTIPAGVYSCIMTIDGENFICKKLIISR